jgi:DNA-directed RNA polymerase subunit RPC12/RpoP
MNQLKDDFLMFNGRDCSDRWVCAKCGRDVEDTVTTAMGKHYHKNCFTCNNCGQQLGNSFVVSKDGRPTCSGCATKVR